MDQQRLAEAEFWLSQQSAGIDGIQASATSAGVAILDRVDDWYDDALMFMAAREAAAASQRAVEQSAGLASQYIATIVAGLRALSRTTVLPTPPVSIRNGVDPFKVYLRPVETYRRKVSLGATNREAIDAAYDRISRLLSADVTLAEREAARRQMAALGVTYFRRVIRPELSKTGTCGLCIAASTQVYRTAVLMPIHDLCKCKAMPIVGKDDPGRTINGQDLDALYASIGETDRNKLKQVRVRVDEHGELGPVLTDANHKFRGPDDIEADTAERAKKELAALIPVLESLEQRAAAGEDVSGPLKYQRDRIAFLRSVI